MREKRIDILIHAMYCPNCGAKNSADQNFCRACGLNLEDIGRSLALQVPAGGETHLERKKASIEKIGKVGLIGLGSVGLIGVAAMIYSIATKFILSGTNIAAGIIFIALLIFAVLSLVYVIGMKSLEDERKSHRTPPIVSDDASTAQLPENRPSPPPSIAEGTTHELNAR